MDSGDEWSFLKSVLIYNDKYYFRHEYDKKHIYYSNEIKWYWMNKNTYDKHVSGECVYLQDLGENFYDELNSEFDKCVRKEKLKRIVKL